MKKMNISLKLNLIIAIGGIIAIASIVTPFFINPSNIESINWQRSQVTLSAIGFIAIFYAFYSTTIQLRKVIAKPKLEVFFTETNKNEKSINVRPTSDEKHNLSISVVNKGNAVTDMFQISYYVPKIYNPTIDYHNIGNEDAYYTIHDGDTDIVSLVNKHKYVCFVDMPTQIPSLVLNTRVSEYANIKNKLVIPYKIYGDWSETQEGKLEVIINKQEVPHAGTG